MPKNPETSKKLAIPITLDKNLVSLKSPTQPLSKIEKEVLHKIYNESIARLTRALDLLSQLETYLASKNEINSIQNIKQLLIDENVNPDVLLTLKMVKRHFYVNVTLNSIKNILSSIQVLKNNLLKTLRGLEGKLDIELKIFASEPDKNIIDQFKKATYILFKKNDTWSVSYFENNEKKLDIAVDDIDSQINRIPNFNAAQLNKDLLMRKFMLYHARQMQLKITPVYVSDLSLKKQHGNYLGYVHASNENIGNYFGAIHIDYELLKSNPYLALSTLLHEASHRYSWVNDRGYYHGYKQKKDGGFRRFPDELKCDSMKAYNNADSYAYFVCELTGNELFTAENSPSWYQSSEYQKLNKALIPEEPLAKALAQEKPDKPFVNSSVLKCSFFAIGMVAVAASAYWQIKKTWRF